MLRRKNKDNYLEEHLDEIRGEFKLLDHWIFLNAADQMIPGNYWLKAVHDFYDFQEAGRMEDIPVQDIATHPFLMTAWSECVERGARLINASKDEVTMMYRPMHAGNLIVNDLLTWNYGENIVFTDLDYPSFPYIFMGVEDRYSIELRRIENVNGEILMSDLEKNIDDNTRLVSINRTTPFCGFTFDVKQVCEIAHDHGAIVLDDAFQALGAIDIDVHDDDVDFLVSGSYKWQCGPEGAGIFYIKRDLLEQFEPVFRNYQAITMPGDVPFSSIEHDNLKSWDYPLKKNAYRYSQDTVIGPALFGWNATLKFYEKIGIKNVEKRVRMLGQYAVEKLQEIGCKILHPTDPKKMHGLITYTAGSFERDLESFERFSKPPVGERPIKVSMRALGGVGGIRISTHFFNTKEEIDKLIDVQRELLVN
jgi:cysteine desulfurase / selenocysteine lyase